MSFNVGSALKQGFARLATVTGAVVLAAYGLFGLLSTVGGQDVYRSVLEDFRDSAFVDDLRAEDPEAADALVESIDQAIADLPLAFGLDPLIGGLLWLAATLGAVVVAVVGLDAFGRGLGTLDGSVLDGLAWRTVNAVVGTVVAALAIVIGFAFLIVPGIVIAVALFFFPAAIAIDGENFFAAFKRSVGVVRDAVVETVALVVVWIVLLIVGVLVDIVLGAALPATAAAVLAEVVNAAITVAMLAVVAVAYVKATTDAAVSAPDPDAISEGAPGR